MEPDHRRSAEVPAAHAELLARLGGDGTWRRLGSGGEATVYALDDHQVLRIQHGQPQSGDELERAYQRWAESATSSLSLPEVLASGVEGDQSWHLVRRFPGRTVEHWLKVLRGHDRARLLDCYVDAAFEVGSIESASSFGELLGGATYPTWADCLRARLQVPDPRNRAKLAADVAGLDAIMEQLERLLPGLYDGEPQLVHVDYFPGNVMAERVGDTGRFRISGVFDFAAHSLFGDPLLDVVGAIVMADMFTDVSVTEQAGMTERARGRAGEGLHRVFESYRAFYALYYAMDEALLPWCAAQLRQASRG